MNLSQSCLQLLIRGRTSEFRLSYSYQIWPKGQNLSGGLAMTLMNVGLYPLTVDNDRGVSQCQTYPTPGPYLKPICGEKSISFAERWKSKPVLVS